MVLTRSALLVLAPSLGGVGGGELPETARNASRGVATFEVVPFARPSEILRCFLRKRGPEIFLKGLVNLDCEGDVASNPAREPDSPPPPMSQSNTRRVRVPSPAVRHSNHMQSTIAVASHPNAVSFCEVAGEYMLSSTPIAARTMTIDANAVRRGVWAGSVFDTRAEKSWKRRRSWATMANQSVPGVLVTGKKDGRASKVKPGGIIIPGRRVTVAVGAALDVGEPLDVGAALDIGVAPAAGSVGIVVLLTTIRSVSST